jgi:hypothetical protein
MRLLRHLRADRREFQIRLQEQMDHRSIPHQKFYGIPLAALPIPIAVASGMPALDVRGLPSLHKHGQPGLGDRERSQTRGQSSGGH